MATATTEREALAHARYVRGSVSKVRQIGRAHV